MALQVIAAAPVRLGYPCGTGQLLPYGRLAARLAVTDLDMVEEQPTPTGQIEAAVALTVLYEPILLILRHGPRAGIHPALLSLSGPRPRADRIVSACL
ncbi:hypothetical protein ACWCPS_39345 [Streptomyces mauvecolor]